MLARVAPHRLHPQAEPGTAALPTPRAFYFGPPDAALFGTIRVPARAWNGTRVLLCSALGYEGLFAYLTLADLAAYLCETTGAVVMTFDYPGLGDSAGDDEEAALIPRALASIDFALDHLKQVGEADGPVLVVGLRAGALLAARAASKRTDVTGVALWAVTASGRAFLREQRAFSQMTYTNPASPTGAAPPWGECGFEANGYVFTEATVQALEALELKTLAKPPARSVLVLQREELAFKVPPAWAIANVEQVAVPGYAGMMEPPWLWNPATKALEILGDWVRRMGSGAELPRPDVRQAGRDLATVSGHAEERCVWYGKERPRFGLLTTPTAGAKSHAALLVTSTYGYRIGPNRVNVFLARRLAEAGVSTLRIDVGGVGDSHDQQGKPPLAPYELAAVDDVNMAIDYLRAAGYERIALSGVCAGAFLAWQAALHQKRPVKLVLANLETFDPIRYTRDIHASLKLRFLTQLRAEPSLLGKARIIGEKLPAFAPFIRKVLVANLPTRLQSDELPAQLVCLERHGSKVTLIFSQGDRGLFNYYMSVGIHHLRLARSTVTVHVVDGADHSFTPRWATDELVELTTREIAAWTP
jgi:pimeloyl-ACP methyl ester carboxylesterase